MVLGDPGEGDDSQYQVLRPLRATSKDTDFTFIVSDVIYPAGDVQDYYDKFYWPYRGLPGPIYAIPGNHDWYDGLHGFMTLLCGADPDLRPPVHASKSRWKRAFLDLTWREPTEALQQEIEAMQQHRPEPSGQPAPYFAIELKELVLVGLDTGIQSGIDDEQGDWFRKISKLPKDKILLTGKPLVVDAARKRCPIAGSADTVNGIVENPAHRYIAVIGGDIHNFQRYPVRHADRRVVQHIVSGAGGAYTKATHKIPKATVESCGCDEDDFRCYPRRGDSLAAYSILLDRKIPLDVAIPYDVAPTVMSLRLDRRRRPDSRRGSREAGSARRLAQGKDRVPLLGRRDHGAVQQELLRVPRLERPRPAALQELSPRRHTTRRGRAPLLRGDRLRGARRRSAARGLDQGHARRRRSLDMGGAP